MDALRILLAILLPPLGVFLQVGLTKHFWINCLLTLLGYIPGIIHAVWAIVHFEKVGGRLTTTHERRVSSTGYVDETGRRVA